MKRVISIILLMTVFCLPSFGQIREIYDDGEVCEHYGGDIFFSLGEAMFSYRVVYGRYPDEKQTLLDYFLEVSKDEYDHFKTDSTIIRMLAERDSILTVDLNAPENVLTVTGDTCTFSYARATREITFLPELDDTVGVEIVRKLSAVQCIGGLAELQVIDYDRFRLWRRSRFYDKDGKCLWALCSESPFMPREVNRQFRYVVTMDPYEEDDSEMVFIVMEDFSPVLVPITITSSGMISYGNDILRLEGVQLYYQELGKPFSSDNAIGTITLKEALDPDHLNAIKTYTKSYFDEHEKVDRMELWELILFNNPPGATSVQR